MCGLRDWCCSGEKCQFIEQLLMWVGGSIKQNDISAAASASDDRHLIIIVCVCYKNVLTHLSTYILRASSSWSFWKTHIEETGEQRKKESSVKIASGSRWKRDHHYYLHLKEKNMKFLFAIWIDYLLALYAIQKQYGSNMNPKPNCKQFISIKNVLFFLHVKSIALFIY